MTELVPTSPPSQPTCNIYQVFASGSEPHTFADPAPLREIEARWIRARQNLDSLEDLYERQMENYGKELEEKEQAAIPGVQDPVRPSKVMLTDDLLLKFEGTPDGQFSGSIFVGVVFGLKRVGTV